MLTHQQMGLGATRLAIAKVGFARCHHVMQTTKRLQLLRRIDDYMLKRPSRAC